ncbi:MAG: tRNA preQ1(34) S-adenosylmethionine ribosyltransferase-isomerase QueA, partial [Deltaproteobacteria bacterium]|nr:tRNA preQ1(34) S-adenosylmethionine ribosyltransferase-isomerase QueA [Deltaproteobacteria bacterium]
MLLEDYDFTLPEELIAQAPTTLRDASRLMCLNRHSGVVEARQFTDILEYFVPGDVLVVNDTKVIPARLLGTKKTGGKVEVFLVRRQKNQEGYEDWLCLTRSSRSLKNGTVVHFASDFQAEVLEVVDAPYRRVRFSCADDFMDMLELFGHLPLPPYIKREDNREDRSRYQTVFAREKGAVAAPTAGLHFTEDVLRNLTAIGVEIVNLTLHVGLGTFLPIRVEDVRQHKMHAESYSISAKTAAAINVARREGRRIFALGTTSARALETAAEDGELKSGDGDSEIFIYPGY